MAGSASIELLRAALSAAMGPLPENDMTAFLLIWEPWSAKRKQRIVSIGETERYLYFVTSGVQRVFYEDGEGREATVVFTYAPSFGGVLNSFLRQEPSKYAYEALTASTFLRAPWSAFDSVTREHDVVREQIHATLVQVIGGLIDRMVELQCYSAADKFRNLVQRSPHILQLVPQKYLANYIGIDKTNFSKLMKSL